MPIIFVLRYPDHTMRVAARHPNSDYFAPFLAQYRMDQELMAQDAAKAVADHLDCKYDPVIRDLL